MIQLYKKGNTLYSQNGDHVLKNTISCELDRTLNGSWELTLKVPLDETGVFLDIVAESVIKAPTPEGDKLFAIYDTEKVSEDSLEACARPVFLNAADEVFLLDIRPTTKNGQEALDILTEGTKYSGRSNITKTNSATYIRKNLMEALASDNDNSFLNRWGGEVLYDDFSIIINDRIGGDYGASIRYGKNLAGMLEKINIEGLVTRIVPIAYNGYTLGGDTPWVDSPLIDLYEHVRTRVIRYDDVKLAEDAMEGEAGYDNLESLRAELIRRCNLEFESGIDKPAITIEADMIDLKNTVEYEEYSILEKMSLGDTVYCQHNKLGVTSTARVIRQNWDCVLRRNISLTIGEFQYNYFDKMSSNIYAMEKNMNPDGTLMADRVAGILNGVFTQLRLQSTVAKKVEGRAFVVEDLDPDSPLYGCMQWGTQGLQISTTRTEDGRDWDWTTAVTARGIIANAIIAGIIKSKDGKSIVIDLDNGKVDVVGDISSLSEENASGRYDKSVLKSYGLQVSDRDSSDVLHKWSNIRAGNVYVLKNGEYFQIDGSTAKSDDGNNRTIIAPNLITMEPSDETGSKFTRISRALIEMLGNDSGVPLEISSDASGNHISGLSAPTASSHAANKEYVDSLVNDLRTMINQLQV